MEKKNVPNHQPALSWWLILAGLTYLGATGGTGLTGQVPKQLTGPANSHGILGETMGKAIATPKKVEHNVKCQLSTFFWFEGKIWRLTDEL